jgi:divinyl protochlorophyllide a 8-vinyl-reductase
LPSARRNCCRRASRRALLAAIGKHTWTFAGGGVFTAQAGNLLRTAIGRCPVCQDASADAPMGNFYAGTFERLFRALVSRGRW